MKKPSPNHSNSKAVERQPAAPALPSRPPYMEFPPPMLVEDQGSDLLDCWHMLRRRKGTLVLIACLGLLAALLATLPQTPVYQARTTIEIQNLNENFLSMRDVNPTSNEASSNPLETDLQTQVNILQSESVLSQVIAKLDLGAKLAADKNQGRLSAWRQALHLPQSKPASTVADILPLVARNLKVRMQANTRLVEILYDSTDPPLAAAIANTLTAEFIRQNLDSRWQTTQKTGEWLTAQMEGVRIKLEKSEEQLQAYARAAGLMFTSEKDNVADEKLRQLEQELSRAQADRVTRQSKYELATRASADSLPEVLDDPTLKDYQVKLTDLRRQLAEFSSTLTPSHPSVRKIQAQVTSREVARETERANVTRRIQNEFESAQRREKLLAASYDAQARVICPVANSPLEKAFTVPPRVNLIAVELCRIPSEKFDNKIDGDAWVDTVSLSAPPRTRTAKVGVIGLGYVGLPLAVEFADAGFSVTSIDVQHSEVDQLNAGCSYIQDVSGSAVQRHVDSAAPSLPCDSHVHPISYTTVLGG